VDKVITALEAHNATQVSELSHNRIWRVASMGESIPYEAFLYRIQILTRVMFDGLKR